MADWFNAVFAEPTAPQKRGWPAIARGESTLILAPTGTGKTLAAFLWSLNRLMFEPAPEQHARCRVLYVSPLKALAVDVERNLRAPLAGIANVAAAQGVPFHAPAIAVRTGDTPASTARASSATPADILITTPESLYLLLTSNARERLRSVETVIIDEIHALVADQTRRAPGAVARAARAHRPASRCSGSACRRRSGRSMKSRGSSAALAHDPRRAQRRRHEGHKARLKTSRRSRPTRRVRSRRIRGRSRGQYRPVTIIDASAPKRLSISVQAPVEDMASDRRSRSTSAERPGGAGPAAPSIWTRFIRGCVELIRAHRSTLLFVNSRRLAERLAGALNELAGEPLVRAHHGSLARAQRVEIEDLLKAGQLRALVATSSLELGIDMGAIDLVVQIEAPPSVASGLQRIGRAGHRIDAGQRRHHLSEVPRRPGRVCGGDRAR